MATLAPVDPPVAKQRIHQPDRGTARQIRGKEGFHPFTKAPIMIKAKPPIIKGFTMRKFKLALASELECHWIR